MVRQTSLLLSVTASLMIVSGTAEANADDPYDQDFQSNTIGLASLDMTRYDHHSAEHNWTQFSKMTPLKKNGTTIKGGGKFTSLATLYQKAILFALNQFWDLKVYIRSMKKECNFLEFKKYEIQSTTKPLEDVTNIINDQVDKLAEAATQNVTFETMVDPVEKEVVENISHYFQQINRSLSELPNEVSKSRRTLFNDVNAADKKLNSCYSRTSKYLTRVKMDILKSKKKSGDNSTIDQYRGTPFPQLTTDYDTMHILRVRMEYNENSTSTQANKQR